MMDKKLIPRVGAALLLLLIHVAVPADAQTLVRDQAFSLRHSYPITDAVWSPDSQTLVTIGFTSFPLAIWDMKRGREIRQIKRGAGYGNTAAFLPDGSALITSVAGENLGAAFTVWDTTSWEISRHVNGLDQGLPAIRSAARYFAIDPESANIAYVRELGPSEPLGIIDTKDWTLKESVRGPWSSIFSINISPKGGNAVVGDLRGQLVVFKLATPQANNLVNAYPGYAVGVRTVAVGPDAKRIVTGASKPRSMNPAPPDPVRIFDTGGTLQTSLKGHFGAIRGLDWSPDGQLIAFASEDGSVYLWRPEDGRVERFAQFFGEALSVKFSPDGKRVASVGSRSVLVHNLP